MSQSQLRAEWEPGMMAKYSRLVNAALIAATVTALLFFAMKSLINSGEGALTDPPKGRVLDFVRVKQDETVQKKDPKPVKPPKPEPPPPQMEQPQVSQTDLSPSSSGGMNFAADLSTTADIGTGLALDSGDGEYLPIVKVAPVYPRRALSRGIEGYVIVEFTVTETGSVTSPTVVEAEPQGIFDQAAKDAALKFKYKPRVVDGEAVKVAGVQNKITFKMN